MNERALTVSELNAYIKRLLDTDLLLSGLWIKGEISNFKNHTSGHMYMTLKDSGGAVRAVMFRSAAQRLKFMPEDGMKVLVFGRVSVFESAGQYQVYIEAMQPDGVGALYVAFEQLKEKLEKEGLFDERIKKPIPSFPEKIAVVTSPTGAAIRDILNVLGRRYPLAHVVVCPVLVQGEGAAAQIAHAIAYVNETHLADVIIAGRGGGSIEDLWAFNEEIVARFYTSDYFGGRSRNRLYHSRFCCRPACSNAVGGGRACGSVGSRAFVLFGRCGRKVKVCGIKHHRI